MVGIRFVDGQVSLISHVFMFIVVSDYNVELVNPGFVLLVFVTKI